MNNFLFFSFSFVSFLPLVLNALPLYTNSRWIVDNEGNRVKLACVNWASHLETMVAEGLSQQPLDVISKKIGSMGFNCVRFTWPLFLVTNESLGSITARQSFQSFGLVESISAFEVHNPSLLDLPVIKVFQVVVSNLAENHVLVILDNHTSKPGWCCSKKDGNGFFGDKYFDPNVWLQGLTRTASMFNDTSNVVGMSLRNELRGYRQNVRDWYRYMQQGAEVVHSANILILRLKTRNKRNGRQRYMQQGAEVVHSANPNLLVILSGLRYDTDLSFLLKKSPKLSFTKKLVFEIHRYGFSDGNAWKNGNPNHVCGRVIGNIMRRAGFLLKQGWPMILSEWGVDQSGSNVMDNMFLNCMIGFAAELDLDWALWTLAGSYYLRQGIIGMDEGYGVLSWDWREIRNGSFIQKISALQSPFQGPGLSEAIEHKVIFHPSSGLCILNKLLNEPLTLGSCFESDYWTYTSKKTLVLDGTSLCLQADGFYKPVKLGISCSDSNSKWERISDSKMHLSSKLPNGITVCLDIDSSNNNIITASCTCLKTKRSCDPGIQWFKIVNSTRSSSAVKLSVPSQSHLFEKAVLPWKLLGSSIQ